jgi:ParB family chromosome partitioning protein
MNLKRRLLKMSKKKIVFDSLFDDDSLVQELPISQLKPYHNHPFRLYEGERLKDMLRSVREVGILVPIVVRDADSGMYEILAGHNRVNAAKQVGLETVPARILENISDDLASLIVTESNLCQRSFSDLPHSERAMALKAHYDALKSQGKRTDILNAVERLITGEGADDAAAEPNSKSRDVVAEKYNLSPQTVSRYVRLALLHKDLLDLVDEGKIAFLAGVELAGLSEDAQSALADFLNRESMPVSIKQAKLLSDHEKLSHDELDDEQIRALLTGDIKKPKAEPAAKVKQKVYRRYFPSSTPLKDIENTIEKALAYYFENGGGEE